MFSFICLRRQPRSRLCNWCETVYDGDTLYEALDSNRHICVLFRSSHSAFELNKSMFFQQTANNFITLLQNIYIIIYNKIPLLALKSVSHMNYTVPDLNRLIV